MISFRNKINLEYIYTRKEVALLERVEELKRTGIGTTRSLINTDLSKIYTPKELGKLGRETEREISFLKSQKVDKRYIIDTQKLLDKIRLALKSRNTKK